MNNAPENLYPKALAHGELNEVFQNVYFVSGAMETVLMEMDWQFSRNMVVVRDGKRLVLINSVRLNAQGLARLDSLGVVTDVIRLGALHGRDDAFYVDKYKAKYWAMPGVDNKTQTLVTELSEECELPIKGASLFQFTTSNVPEAIIILPQNGGIAIACDALQNWLSPDEHFCEHSTERMQQMGFFKEANVGPVWQQVAEPEAKDFIRLKELSFKHALCGHGEPLKDKAKEAYLETFSRLFNI